MDPSPELPMDQPSAESGSSTVPLTGALTSEAVAELEHATGSGDGEATASRASNPPSNASEHSDSSTLVYGHEAFESFQHCVIKLVSSVFTEDEAAGAVVTRLQGGFYNRVIGISLPQTDREFILRIPRFSAASIQHQVDTLSWLRRSTKLPVPVVVAFDVTDANAIGEPYVLMERLAGTSLYHVVDKMSADQRVALAIDIAHLIASIHAAPVPSGIGPLSFNPDSTPFAGAHMFVDGDQSAYKSPPSVPLPAPSTLSAFLSASFSAQHAYALERRPKDTDRLQYLSGLIPASEALTANLGSAQVATSVLFHRDFAARNVLVREVTSDTRTESTWEISGVLDWDECELAPPAVAYVCPGWLWTPPGKFCESDEDEDDYDPDETPADEVGVRAKAAFVSAIEAEVPGYMDTLRTSRQRKLRQAYELARMMAQSAEQEETARAVVAAAAAIK